MLVIYTHLGAQHELELAKTALFIYIDCPGVSFRFSAEHVL